MDLYAEENEIPEKEEEHIHNEYKLIIKHYKTGPGSWNYTQGFVYKGEQLIGFIKRNYCEFPFCFFSHYLVSGRSYMKQTFLDLDTGEIYDNCHDASSQFCWSSIYTMDDQTLVAHGCFWGGGYEYVFYDVSDLTKGWPELTYDVDLHKFMEPNHSVVSVKDGKIIIKSHDDFDDETDEPIDDIYIITLKRVNNKIVQSDLWLCDRLFNDIHHDMYQLLLSGLKARELKCYEYISGTSIHISVTTDVYHRMCIENNKLKYLNFNGVHKDFDLTIEAIDELLLMF